VYEKAHKVSEDVTLQHRELKAMDKDMENHLYLNHSKQKTKIIKAHVVHPTCDEREREMSESWIPKD
jgi:hypothetical protein